jgi:type I restriction modification DNA specificity protein
MNQALLQTLRALRNEIVHGQRHADAEHLGMRLKELGISVPPEDLQWFVADLLRGFSHAGEHFVPPVLLSVIRSLLERRSAGVACDPWAGFGVLAATVADALQAKTTVVCTRSQQSAALGRVLAPNLDWHTGDPLSFLETLTVPLDVVASVPPFGVRDCQPVELLAETGEPVRFAGDLASVLVAAASSRLSPDGLGLFVVASSVFFAQRSVLRDLSRLGLGVEAALALPAGSFAPFTNISTYLIVLRKRAATQMFVAQLSQDPHTNRQIVANLRERRADGALDLGRFVTPEDFRGLESLRLTEQLQHSQRRFHAPAVRLGDLAEEIRFGRAGDEFNFPPTENAFYIPLIGISDVVDSTDGMTLKRQNYAQVVVNAARPDARFVAHFLNSELGRAIREANKSGTTIPKLNTSALRELPVFVPDLATQKKILDVAAKLAAEQNTVLGLQNDLDAMHRELWSSPDQCDAIASRVQVFSGRLAQGAAPHAAATLDQWFETLPFPLASILRAWQATPSQDFKSRYEHLLHFFEAAAEFLSVIYLSAFASQPEVFATHRGRLAEAWKKQKLSLQRSSFGTWKVVVEYLGKQTRELLSGDAVQRTLCGELFVDPTQTLPEMLARKELVTVLAAANKMRNDWAGHGGVVGQAEARLRNEQLLAELQKLREAMAGGWRQVQLLRCLQCWPRRGAFDNEVAVLVGSNSEFLKESRSMSSWLDVERLYLASRDSGRALLLLPLIQVGPSPASAKNACYFFSRVDKDGARFVSYHFVDQPELKDSSADTASAIELLSGVGAGDDH